MKVSKKKRETKSKDPKIETRESFSVPRRKKSRNCFTFSKNLFSIFFPVRTFTFQKQEEKKINVFFEKNVGTKNSFSLPDNMKRGTHDGWKRRKKKNELDTRLAKLNLRF